MYYLKPTYSSNENHYTVLHAAAKEGHVETVELLLQQGASIDAQCINGRTALMLATINGHEKVVALLRSSNANVNIADNEGNTALHWAAQQNWVEVVKLLLNHSFLPTQDGSIRLINLFPLVPTANIFHVNHNGKKAIDYAKHAVHALLKEAEVLSNNLSLAITSNDNDNILLYLSSGACISDEMIDSAKNNAQITEWLCEAAPTKIKRSLK